jgi:hypothetical protein
MTKRVFAPQFSEMESFQDDTQMEAKGSLKEERDYASNTECCIQNVTQHQKQSRGVCAEHLDSKRSSEGIEIEKLKSSLKAAHAAQCKAVDQERLLKGLLEETACESFLLIPRHVFIFSWGILG